METIRETRQIVIDQMLTNVLLPNNCSILEPSAGYGSLVNGILQKNPSAQIDCIELNGERFAKLQAQGFNALKADFLKVTPTKLYDFVIACPTYKDSTDCEHIMHMYDFLKQGGQLVSLTHPIWTMSNTDIQIKFREWLVDKRYQLRMLKDFSFVENFETQPSMILTLRK